MGFLDDLEWLWMVGPIRITGIRKVIRWAQRSAHVSPTNLLRWLVLEVAAKKGHRQKIIYGVRKWGFGDKSLQYRDMTGDVYALIRVTEKAFFYYYHPRWFLIAELR